MQHVQFWANTTLIEQYDVWLNRQQLNVLWSTIVSIFLIGGAISSLGGAWIADRFGRYIITKLLAYFTRKTFHGIQDFI